VTNQVILAPSVVCTMSTLLIARQICASVLGREVSALREAGQGVRWTNLTVAKAGSLCTDTCPFEGPAHTCGHASLKFHR
jgi:hypothetical protein